jgi:hypothetical protein
MRSEAVRCERLKDYPRYTNVFKPYLFHRKGFHIVGIRSIDSTFRFQQEILMKI